MAELVRPPLPAAREVEAVGHADERFGAIREVFTRAAASQGGQCAFALWHDGQLALDLRAGGMPATALQPLYSVTKSLSAVAAWHAHERGLLDLHAPMADYWPELDRRSTRAITLALVLSHRSGLVSFDRPLSLDEMLAGADDDAFGRQDPFWEPGTRHGYHAFSLGTAVRGAFRRVLGTTVGQYLREQVLGQIDAEVWIGAPEEACARVTEIDFWPPAVSVEQARHRASSPIPPSGLGPLLGRHDAVNDPRVRAADWPAGSGLSNARSLATTFGAVTDGIALAPTTRDAMAASQAAGHDEVLGVRSHYGTGVQLPSPLLPFATPHSFGHEGAGGTLVLADPSLGLALAWTTSIHPAVPGASGQTHALVAAARQLASEEWRG